MTIRVNTSTLIRINGQDVICNADGTALFEGGRLLVVSDLHLEKGRALSATAPIPQYDTDETLKQLEDAVATHKPEKILMLGDSFHRTHLAESLSPAHRKQIEAMAKGREMIWIVGNHDPELPEFLPGIAREDYVSHGIWFRHIATEGRIEGGEVSGHYHPKVRIKTRARAISGKCFIHDGMRMIMPAFGAYTGGLSVFNEAIAQRCPQEAEILFCHACEIYRYPYSHVITG